MPKAPKRLCACGAIVQGKCPKCTRQVRKASDARRLPPSRRGPYTKSWWEPTRRRILLRDLYQCQACDTLVGRRPRDAHIDHIDGNKDNNDDSNLQTLCQSCHSRKTVLEDGGFGR